MLANFDDAGYSAIMEECSSRKKDLRLKHLKDLMYLATKFQWKFVLQFHAACLLEIERGNLRWGDSFQELQYATLAGGMLSSRNNSQVSFTGASGGKQTNNGDKGKIFFCKGYQHGFCSQTSDHQGEYKGETCTLRHICGNCWLHSKKVNAHPESSNSCPLKNSGLQS